MKLFRYISIIALAAATAVNAYADKTNFRWIKDIDYAKVRHFSQGHSAFQENGKWGFINTAGEVVVEPQYDECHDYHNGYAAVKVNGKWGYIDIKHNLVIAPEFQDVEDFKNDLAIVIRDGKWGVIVSEETGTISVAVGGMLKRHRAPQTLERLLRNELAPEQNEGEGNALTRLKEKLQGGKEDHKNEK